MFEGLLENKKILLGISGSIAIYKSLELIRHYRKAGAEVRVVMSDAARRFISPLTFEAISGREVLTPESESWASDNNHIDIGKWADLFVLAPASANTINKLKNGIADNLLLQTALAHEGPKVIAPAANTRMLKNPATEGSIKMLRLMDYHFVKTQTKALACGETGEGAMADPLEIFYQSAKYLLRSPFWENRRVVVSGGGTRERIDDVRYLSNFSSGKMAKALATALWIRGSDVCLVTTRLFDDLPEEVYQIDVESAEEMAEYLEDAIRIAKKGVMTKPTLMDDSMPERIMKRPYLFMAAAVSDYRPAFPQKGKLKKETLGEKWSLELVKSVDILATLDKRGIYSVGFKAETDEKSGLENALKALESKKLDAICLNDVSKHPFGSDENRLTLITETARKELPAAKKLSVAFTLLDTLEEIGDE